MRAEYRRLFEALEGLIDAAEVHTLHHPGTMENAIRLARYHLYAVPERTKRR